MVSQTNAIVRLDRNHLDEHRSDVFAACAVLGTYDVSVTGAFEDSTGAVGVRTGVAGGVLGPRVQE